MTFAARLESVREQIARAARRAGRDPGSIRLVAVTKGVEISRIREALLAGVTDIGENRVQEAAGKFREIGPEAAWHFIGRLQTNKVRYLFPKPGGGAGKYDHGPYALIHSVDRPGLAREIDRRAGEAGIRQPILIEVNVAGEAQKGGVAEAELPELVHQVMRSEFLDLRGLMTVAPHHADPEEARPVFRRLAELRRELEEAVRGLRLPELSMGMTGDFAVAIEEGATLVRIGRALFGERTT